MKIAFFTDTYLPTVDGVVTSVLSAKKGLQENGHEIMILAPYCENSPEEQNTIYCKSRKFKMYPGYNLASFLPREVKAIKDFNPDVLHTHGVGSMGIKSLWFSKDLSVPTVLTFHTMVTDAINHYSPLNLKPDLLVKLLKFFLKSTVQRFNAVIVPAVSILPEIAEIAPNMKHVEVVPTGVDCNRFRPNINSSRIKEKWGLDDSKIILSVGRIAEEKKLEIIIEAMPLVQKEFPNAKLLLVGSGPALPKYKEMVLNKGLGNDVIFTGFVPDEDLPLYYTCCDLFTTASKFETQGLVVLEAMASGKPVVGANFRAIPEYVIDEKTGYLFEPDNIASCAQSIIRCLNSPDALGKNARVLAENCSVESSTKKLIEVYKKVINNSKNK